MDKFITIRGINEERCVLRNDYIKAKTAQLKDFGYTNLSELTVEDQLDRVLAKETKMLTVIGMLIQDDVKIN
jgi:hypothetical protein